MTGFSLLGTISVVLLVTCQSLEDGNVNAFHQMERQVQRNSFVQGERAIGDVTHEVVIAIHQNNIPKLKKMVRERATPGNPLYQKWFTYEEIGNMVQNVEAYDKVATWLTANDVQISASSPHKEYITASAPISKWETMLQTQFYQFKDTTHPQEKLLHRALEYSIPMELKGHIESIFHTVQTPPRYHKKYEHALMKQQKDKKTGRLPYRTNLRIDNVFKGSVTVSFIDSLYKISSNVGSSSLQQSVFETSNEYMEPSDLTAFQETYGLSVQSALNTGGHTTTTCGGDIDCEEGNLDIQYIMGIAQQTASIFWYVSDSNGDPFVSWITAVAGESHPPQSNSLSWGEAETAMQQSTANAWDNEALKLAGQGVTIMVSSGDNGAMSIDDQSGTCLCPGVTWSTTVDKYNPSTGYNPSFPATSEWVTAVGATQGPEIGNPEIACQSQQGGLITSGGGFSYFFERPSYQNNALNYYFNTASKANPPLTGFNANGRGYPDVALIGVNYNIIINGESTQVFGTSCSAPVFAGFVSLVNAARLKAGKPSIGFINPTMYQVGYNNTIGVPNIYNAKFNDVTSGINSCCAGSDPTQVSCCTSGFSAVKGWDPITGWGSINYPEFSAIFEVATPYNPPSNAGDATFRIWSLLLFVNIGIILLSFV